MLISRWKDKQNVVYPHNGILSSLKNKGILIYATIWMDLEDFMLWEVSQTQEDNTVWFHIHMYLYHSWIFIGRTNAEPEAPVLWPPDVKSQHIGKCWDRLRQEKKGETEDEMVGWHHRLNGHEFEWTPGDSEERTLACCSPGGCKTLDMTEQLSNNNHLYVRHVE